MFSFSGVPDWFYILAVVVVVGIVLVNEWWTR